MLIVCEFGSKDNIFIKLIKLAVLCLSSFDLLLKSILKSIFVLNSDELKA